MPTKVSEYMTPKVITVEPHTGLREAFFMMKDEAIRHLPVVDAQGELVGIVSDRELRRPGWVDETPEIGHEYQLTDDLLIQDVMCTDVVSVHTYDTLSRAIGTILEHQIGAAPVLNKSGELVGMLSAVDLLKAFQDSLEHQKTQKKKKAFV
ncbi:CBS domain-containing protein [Photobacterium ganghwense]|uniref:Histidine kinase n=1 Tax=Photobacterium ganghwense TaxID=320778 RepID=A0A0J1HII8_9GAMM|nr:MULTISPECIES: CBS domain-containing protein [Photobacterium]KLV11420.1 histidine kinase [Photobacterium ganghwense]PSU08274.1 CBS domain-containing protein [Photobacterium ganghwense]QSV15085.1 CBS domain-containing protein [Photobacterium ganghwense]